MRAIAAIMALGMITGCAEVAPPARDAAGDSTAERDAAVTDATVAQDSGVMANDSAVDAGASRVVINEIRAEGEDWIELVNVGTATADLSGWGVSDSDGDGDARVAMAARFPAGTTLAPAAYLLLVVDQADAGTGPQMRCLVTGGPTTCFHGSFGISASNGESVHLIDPSGRVIESANYPMNAAMTGESWGRLPNGVGSFARNRLTPGEANRAP